MESKPTPDLDAVGRRKLLKTGLVAASAGLWPDSPFEALASANEKKQPKLVSNTGRDEILKGLDGMSRVADGKNNPFVHGHNAAAVISSAFFCREQNLDEETRKGILSLMENRLLKSRIYVSRPEESADPALIAKLVKDLEKEEAISLLQKLQKERTEVSIGLKSDRILYSKTKGKLRLTEIAGSLVMVAPWKHLFKESIAEFHKNLGVAYDTVVAVEGPGKNSKAP